MPSITPSSVTLHPTLRTYTTADGLAGMRVEDIVEDRDGYLWFATSSSGVSRFDGEIFQHFTRSDGLTGLQVMAMHLDRAGRLWLGTLDGGLCRFDGQSFRGFESGNGVSDGPIECLFEDQRGWLYFAGIDVLGYWDGQRFIDLRPALYRDCGIESFHGCWGIDQDGEGHIWFAFYRGCLLRFDGTSFCNMATALPVEGMHSAVGCDEQGTVWVCLGPRLWRYDGRQFREEAKPTEAIVRKFQRDASGQLWMCTSGDGAYGLEEGQWHPWAPPNLLPNPSVNCVCEDREGHLWFATWGGGACRCDTRIVHITSASGLPADPVSSLVADRENRLWMGFWNFGSPPDRCIARFDGKTIEVLGAENGLAIDSCSALHIDRQGALWIGDFAGRGLYQYGDEHAFHAIIDAEAFAGHNFTALAEDREGHLLLGYEAATEEGGYELRLSRWDGHQLERLCGVPSGYNSYITAIVESGSGSLWFGIGALGGVGKSQGLVRLDPKTGVAVYSTVEGLPDNRVYDLLEDRQGQLWIATAAGVCRFDGQTFHTFTSAHGLPSEFIQGLSEDRQGQLWVATDAGVCRFTGQLFQRVLSKQVGSTFKVVQDGEGRYWFGTDRGLVGYTPDRRPPRVRILRVLADQIYPEPQQLQLAASMRQIAFEFKGMSFRTFVGDMLYCWRLQGHQDQWQSPTAATDVVYTGLAPGNYLFQVRAIDQDGNVSEAPAEVELEILPDPLLSGLAKSLAQSNGEFVGASAALRQVQTQFRQVAQTDLSVLILGETGTGKGLSAKTIHQLSPRREGPYIPVNCGAIPEGLVESELFGHEKGAFTGASQRQLGKVELAVGGTLFLDEIGDMPLAAQIKLLRFLEDFTFERVGGRQSLKADVRIVAATNRELEQMVAAGSFREDLYFRLKIFPVQLPSLRQRVEDIPLLARYFIDRFAHHLNRPVPKLGEGAIVQLQAYSWPGNVRELEHVIQRAVLLCQDSRIEREDVAVLLKGTDKSPQEDEGLLTLAEREKRHILRALELTDWVIEGAQGAAQLLDINPSTLRLRMKKHGIVRPQ